MNIEPVADKVFGAIVTGVSIPTLSGDEFRALHAALLEYGFLVLPEQHLTSDESRAFGERFGDLEFGGIPMANIRREKDGSWGDLIPLTAQAMRTNVGNEAWHTDSTYRPCSSKVAMLSAVILPEEGGGTELADARHAYDCLDEATKERIADLSAYHSTEYSQARDVGDIPVPESGAYAYHGEAYLRRIVKVHPETGRPSLMIGRHAFGVPGLSRDESRELLASLVEFTVSDERRVYHHDWQPGDTLLWDNRCLLHRAMPYDYEKPRALFGTRVAGDPESELAYYPEDPAAAAGREALKAELELLRNEVGDRLFAGTTASN